MAMRLAAALLILAVLPAWAQGSAAYGGSGQEALHEAIRTADGLFAVGETASTDGDLAGRTRSGEAGWALRLDEAGHVLWSFSSAHNGLMRMISPYAFEDGTFSCVLTEENGQRGEWIRLEADGRQKARVEIPSAAALCGQEGHVEAVLAYEDAQGQALAVLIAHPGEETMCCARVLEEGEGIRGMPFAGDAQGAAAMDVSGEQGELVHFGVRQGKLVMTRVLPGSEEPACQAVLALPEEGAFCQRVTDVLAGEDGSVVLCGQALAGEGESEGFIMRLSAEGEAIFFVMGREYSHFVHLAATETGYAAYAYGREEGDGQVLFLDEDGACQDAVAVRDDLADLADGSDGVVALYNLRSAGGKQAVFETVIPDETEQEPGQERYAGCVYAAQGCTLLSAWGDEAGFVLACRREDGQADVTCLDTHGNTVLHCAGVAGASGGCVGRSARGDVLALLTGDENALFTVDGDGRMARHPLPAAYQIAPGEAGEGRVDALTCAENSLLCARLGEERVLVCADAQGTFVFTRSLEQDADFTDGELGALALENGWLVYGPGKRGAQLLRLSASGELLWQTRTPIHTAADALEWLCAVELDDGEMLLAGRYLTGQGDAAGQEGVAARIGRGGELKEIRNLSGVGAVYDMVVQEGHVCMLVSLSSRPSLLADALLLPQGDGQGITALPYPVKGDGARLLADEEGGLLVAGTAQEEEKPTALLQLVP